MRANAVHERCLGVPDQKRSRTALDCNEKASIFGSLGFGSASMDVAVDENESENE